MSSRKLNGKEIGISVYQATAFYDDIVQALQRIEYPSVGLVSGILMGMGFAWLRGSGTRVTPKNCGILISAVMNRRKRSGDSVLTPIDRLIDKALRTLGPTEYEGSPDGTPQIYPSGGLVCPMAHIDGLGRIVAPVGADGPFVMNLNNPTIVFEDVEHMTRVMADWWDVVIEIESIRTRREGRVIPSSYSVKAIRELESEFHDYLNDQASQGGD